jgi:DNA-binding response OmpR family regulator
MSDIIMHEVAQKSRILIVDDEPAIQQVLCFFFKLHKFEVLGVPGGQEAIQVIPDFRPHLIVLDLVMRPVSGWDVLEWLHAHRQTTQIPVLVVSALVNLTEQLHGFEKGAIDYITKPTQPSVIVERVQALLAMSAEQRTMLQHKRMDEQRRILEHLYAAQSENFMY